MHWGTRETEFIKKREVVMGRERNSRQALGLHLVKFVLTLKTPAFQSLLTTLPEG
jgi:hypothetical protein